MQYKITYTYTNETNEVVMLADGREILAVGLENIARKEQEIAAKYPTWTEDLGDTPWGLIEYVKPGETVSSTSLKDTEPINLDIADVGWNNLFQIEDK